MVNNEFLKIRGISKRFGATIANSNIDLTLGKGETWGFAGENGSGKSTLCSIIGGLLRPDAGELFLNGQRYAPVTSVDANGQGVAMVVQEAGVIENLSVAENIFLGKTDRFARGGLLRVGQMHKAAGAALKKWGIHDIKPDVMAGFLTIEQRKLVELVRALSEDPDILILDEITQALSHDNRELLYEIKDSCIEMGKTVIMVTHDIEEMLSITDHIAVLRDGVLVGTAISKDTAESELKRMMVGRELSEEMYRSDSKEDYEDEVVLSVQQLSDTKLKDISFELHKGEILALYGLSDAGSHEVGEAIFGLREGRRGKVVHLQSGKSINKPADLIDSGGAYVPKDRDHDGLMLDATPRDNLLMPSVKLLANRIGFIRPSRVKDLVRAAVDSFSIVTRDPDRQAVKTLSGGNKQKVNLGRWLIQDLDWIVMDSPTRGVDVAVKAYIYERMLQAKSEGLAILMITDELPEAIGMADRILVLKDGSIVETFRRSEGFSEEAIVEVMM